MLQGIPLPAVVVDIETTGGSVTRDRITEIGIIEITASGVSEWSTLINPRQPISAMIERITGISNVMVKDAPYFEQIARQLVERCAGRVFIAHNVRFDYGFIRNEFARLGYSFRAPLLCTVKLSRALYPDADGHSLEKIIRRHQIYVTQRHRALADARATYQFLTIAEAEHGAARISAAAAAQGKRMSLPPHIDDAMINALPKGPGVYYFWGDTGALLYVGKSIHIRKRVLSHFTADHQSAKEMQLSQATRRITADPTLGELSALILESQQIKALQPLYNRRLRRTRYLHSIGLISAGDEELLQADFLRLDDNFPRAMHCYGLFASPAAAKSALKDICNAEHLCYQACGLEPVNSRPCSAYQLKRCRGWCAGVETSRMHNTRLITALSNLALKVWPYAGPVAIVESNSNGDSAQILVDNWCILGTARDFNEQQEILAQPPKRALDRDIYYYLVDVIYGRKRSRILPLAPNLSP